MAQNESSSERTEVGVLILIQCVTLGCPVLGGVQLLPPGLTQLCSELLFCCGTFLHLSYPVLDRPGYDTETLGAVLSLVKRVEPLDGLKVQRKGKSNVRDGSRNPDTEMR